MTWSQVLPRACCRRAWRWAARRRSRACRLRRRACARSWPPAPRCACSSRPRTLALCTTAPARPSWRMPRMVVMLWSPRHLAQARPRSFSWVLCSAEVAAVQGMVLLTLHKGLQLACLCLCLQEGFTALAVYGSALQGVQSLRSQTQCAARRTYPLRRPAHACPTARCACMWGVMQLKVKHLP